MADTQPVPQERVDPVTGLSLPDPFPEYVPCPHCGEPEVEVYCYEKIARCRNCGKQFPHTSPPDCGLYPFCKRAVEPESDDHEG
ncbi:MAG: hypothetical protein FJ030_09750 [Chloroflexi bacterium]|nr:hypothetical protein [Chloroflexota bacterium]